MNTPPPIREKPFLPTCMIAGNERELLLACLESQQWCGFRAGGGGWDMRDLLKRTSAEVAEMDTDSVKYLGGRYVRRLEFLYAQACDVPYAVACNSATSGLIMALGALGVGPGDEVLVPAMSFHATATTVLHHLAVPVFVEVKEDTFCLDPQDLAAKITPRSKAIVVVHLGGNTADMDAVLALAKIHDLAVVEDCAQAPGVSYRGKPVGTLGDVGVFSLTETKNITCGEGGVVVTTRPDVAFKTRLIRNHGEAVAEDDWDDEELNNVVGMNFRLTDLQAAVAIPQFGDLTRRNQIRRENAAYLTQCLAPFPQLVPQQPEDGADYVCYIAKWRYQPDPGMPDRDSVCAAMKKQGIPLLPGYARLMYENPIFTRRIAFGAQPFAGHGAPLRYGPGTCPRAEQINREFLWFTFVHPPQTTRDMDDVAAAFETVLRL